MIPLACKQLLQGVQWGLFFLIRATRNQSSHFHCGAVAADTDKNCSEHKYYVKIDCTLMKRVEFCSILHI